MDFLNDDLEEEIYMDQPEDFIVHNQKYKVCKLTRSLCGLKQAPKQWHEKFDATILSYGFHVIMTDECVYYKEVNDQKFIL